MTTGIILCFALLCSLGEAIPNPFGSPDPSGEMLKNCDYSQNFIEIGTIRFPKNRRYTLDNFPTEYHNRCNARNGPRDYPDSV